MEFKANRLELQEFVESASFSNISYFRVRRDLFEAFCSLVEGGRDSDDSIVIGFETFQAVKSFLISRNEQLDDNKRLSFERALYDLSRHASGDGRRVARAAGSSYRATPRRHPPSEPSGGGLFAGTPGLPPSEAAVD